MRPEQEGKDAPEPQPERGEPKLADPSLRDLTLRDWLAIFQRAGKETVDDNVPMKMISTVVVACLCRNPHLWPPQRWHGVEFGISKASTRDLHEATHA